MDTTESSFGDSRRYHRQTLLSGIGTEGQARLGRASVLLVGCGALGGVVADQLVRAGVGFLRLIDRDVVELTNLQRQVLFDEADVRQHLPKAIAAANRLRRINSDVVVEPHVADVHPGNAEELISGARDSHRVDLILDGTDNAETRYLLNDVAVKYEIPWVYGACTGTDGRMMFIWPGRTACLRCLFPAPPAPGELPTCDTVGVLGPGAAMVASMQALAAIKFLVAPERAVGGQLHTWDFWNERFRSISVGERASECPCCGRRRFDFLESGSGAGVTQLCGRDAVQVRQGSMNTDLSRLARRLRAVGHIEESAYFLRYRPHDLDSIVLTIFVDGRTIVHGTADPAQARVIAAKYVGI